MGINQSNLITDGELPLNNTVQNNVGYRLGLVAEYNAFDFVAIRPQVALSFNNAKATYALNGLEIDQFSLLSDYLEFGVQLVGKPRNSANKPYFFIGPTYKYNLKRETDYSPGQGAVSDLAIDFGIGFDKSTKYFRILPELRYSYGLKDINFLPDYPKTYFHSVSLLFHFIE